MRYNLREMEDCTAPIPPLSWGDLRSAIASGAPLPTHWYVGFRDGVFDYIGIKDFSYQRWWQVLDQLYVKTEGDEVSVHLRTPPDRADVCLYHHRRGAMVKHFLEAASFLSVALQFPPCLKNLSVGAVRDLQEVWLLRQRSHHHPMHATTAHGEQALQHLCFDIPGYLPAFFSLVGTKSTYPLLTAYWANQLIGYPPPSLAPISVLTHTHRPAEVEQRLLEIFLKKLALGVPLISPMQVPIQKIDVILACKTYVMGDKGYALPEPLIFQPTTGRETEYDLAGQEGGFVAAFNAYRGY